MAQFMMLLHNEPPTESEMGAGLGKLDGLGVVLRFQNKISANDLLGLGEGAVDNRDCVRSAQHLAGVVGQFVAAGELAGRAHLLAPFLVFLNHRLDLLGRVRAFGRRLVVQQIDSM